MNIVTDIPCPFPDDQCVPCLLKVMEPEKRQGVGHLVRQLPQMGADVVERCLRTIKLMAKGQQPLKSPYSPYAALEPAVTNAELEYLVACGLLPALVEVAEKTQAPFSRDYALDVIALFLASTKNPSYAEDLVRNHNLVFRVTGLLIATDISTLRGSALNVLSAVFRATNAASYLATSDPDLLRDLVKVLVANAETPDHILLYELGLLDDEEDFGRGEKIAADGDEKLGLIDDALTKSLCLSETGEPSLPVVHDVLCHPDVLEFLFESVNGELPPAYPDSDRPLEAAVCIAALCSTGEQVRAKLVAAGAVPVLLEAVTYALASLCNSAAFSSAPASDAAVKMRARAVLQSVVQTGLYGEPPDGASWSPEEAGVKRAQLSRIFLAKGRLVGDRYFSLLYCPPAVDSACLAVARLGSDDDDGKPRGGRGRTGGASGGGGGGLLARIRPEVKGRLEQSRQTGDAEFAAGRYRSAKDYYGLSAELAEAIGDRDRCCLCLTNKAECELQLGQWRSARDTALKSLRYCSDQHKHYAKTVSRRDRATKHLET